MPIQGYLQRLRSLRECLGVTWGELLNAITDPEVLPVLAEKAVEYAIFNRLGCRSKVISRTFLAECWLRGRPEDRVIIGGIMRDGTWRLCIPGRECREITTRDWRELRRAANRMAVEAFKKRVMNAHQLRKCLIEHESSTTPTRST